MQKKHQLVSLQTREWIRRATETPGIEVIPLLPEISYESNYLPPPFHRDPADQMIVATARVCELTLITCDDRIFQHVRTLWGRTSYLSFTKGLFVK